LKQGPNIGTNPPCFPCQTISKPEHSRHVRPVPAATSPWSPPEQHPQPEVVLSSARVGRHYRNCGVVKRGRGKGEEDCVVVVVVVDDDDDDDYDDD